MRRLLSCAMTIAALGFLTVSVRGATPGLDQWFLHATSYAAGGTAHKMSSPDFLLGKTRRAQCAVAYDANLQGFYGVWQLLKYDRRHHIALARASTDQDSCALFAAPPPGVPVPDADLSHACTGRGICVGTPFAKVLATYGPAPRRGRHFVTFTSQGFPIIRSAVNRSRCPSK